MALTPQDEGRGDAVCIAALALIAPVLLWDVLAGRSGLFARDLFRYSLPMKKLVRDALLGGEFPHWEPALASGQPLAANPAFQLFYPPQWILGLFDLLTGFHLLIVLHLSLLAIGMFVLLRMMGASRAAAMVGASAAAFGGIGLSIASLLPMLFSVSWVPWIFSALLFLSNRWSGRIALFFALSIALQLTTGEPTIILQTHAIILVAFVITFFRTGTAAPRHSSLVTRHSRLAAVYLLGIALAAAMWLPAIDHVRDSARSLGARPGDAVRWSLPLARLPEIAVRDWFGPPAVPETYRGGRFYPEAGAPYLFSIYSGSVVATLAIAGMAVRFRFRWALFAVAAGSALFAIGGRTPLFPLIASALPVRYPEKFAAAGILAVLCIAVLTLDRCLREERVAKRVAIFAGAGAVLLTASSLSSSGAARSAAAAAAGWAIVALAALLAARQRRRASIALFAVLTAAELAPLPGNLLPRMPRDFFDPPPAVLALRRSSAPSRIFHDGDFGATSREAAAYRRTMSDRGWFARNAVMPRTPWLWGYQTALQADYDETLLLPARELLLLYHELRDVPAAQRMLLRMSNVRHLVRVAPYSERGAWFVRSPATSVPVNVIELPYAPRYHFSRDVRTASPAQIAAILRRETIDPATAFVTDGAFRPARGVVRGFHEWRNRVTLEVEADGVAFLVASVTRHRYWSATIDGRPAGLVPVNVAYQGLEVPAGAHRIELRYRNPNIARGMIISLLALVGLVVLIVATRRSREPAREGR